jgi:HK97 family phage major capsid protein
MIIPWGKVARSGFSSWKFAEGSLHWSDVSRVKLNLNHNFDQAVGVAIRLQPTSQGLDGTFRIAKTEEGDKALALAAEGVLDGFSAEVEFNADAGDDWQPDPSDESVRLVRSGTLRGTALTGYPAFDDARLTSVNAMREGNAVTGPTTKTVATAAAGTAPDPSAEGFAQFMNTLGDKIAESQKKATEGLTDKIGEMLSEGIKAALENIHDPQTDGPQPVRAARWTVTREAPVYSLDGRGPCLVRDAWHAQMSRDDEAMARIRKFRQQSEEMAKLAHDHLHMSMTGSAQFATSTTATNPQIIPPGYRPDLFIPMLNQQRPFASALSQGVIANATPFVVPVFGSFTGATADHVENVNPTDGTLAFTTKTVTPGAISGLLKLTREIVDSSNPAIDQIALAAMRESYARQTEGKVYTLLNGSSGQGGTITAAPPPANQGFVPSGAQVATATGTDAGGLAGAALLDAIRSQMALYPFRRFAAPDLALMSQEATTAFAKAKDTTGRPLLPSVGAMNTAGLGNAITQGWFVDGLAHIPAWAISGNAAGDADTFMLNRADAWVWESPLLTFRYEERSGPAVIDLALFGYFATHLLRPVGLSSVRLTVT